MVIAIDFDGTCTTHEFPKVGKDIGAAPVLKKLVEAGHKLILYTMRCNHETAPVPEDETIQSVCGSFLDDAEEWFKVNEIPLYGIQRNPTQDSWTTSYKCYAELYIDDAALGCPLTWDKELSDRPFVDWKGVELMLKVNGII